MGRRKEAFHGSFCPISLLDSCPLERNEGEHGANLQAKNPVKTGASEVSRGRTVGGM